MISLAVDVCVNEALWLCVHAFVDVWEGYMCCITYYLQPHTLSYYVRLLQTELHNSFSEMLICYRTERRMNKAENMSFIEQPKNNTSQTDF